MKKTTFLLIIMALFSISTVSATQSFVLTQNANSITYLSGGSSDCYDGDWSTKGTNCHDNYTEIFSSIPAGFINNQTKVSYKFGVQLISDPTHSEILLPSQCITDRVELMRKITAAGSETVGLYCRNYSSNQMILINSDSASPNYHYLYEMAINWSVELNNEISFTGVTNATVKDIYNATVSNYVNTLIINVSNYSSELFIIYGDNQQYVHYNNGSTLNKTLFITPITSSGYVKVVDGSVQKSNAYVRVYDVYNTSFLEVYSDKTDSEGKAYLKFVNGRNYLVCIDIIGKSSVCRNYVLSYDYTKTNPLLINIGTSTNDLTLGFFSLATIKADVYHSNNNMTLDFNDVSGINSTYCLFVFKGYNFTKTIVGSSCLTNVSGTIKISTPNISGMNYNGWAYLNDTMGNLHYLNSFEYTYYKAPIFGNFGLFLQILLTITFAFLSLASVAVGVIIVPLSLIIGNYVGLNHFSMVSLSVLQVVGVIIAIIIAYKK